jgi:hypothetical protein
MQVKAAAASAAAVVLLTLKANTQLLLDLRPVVMIKAVVQSLLVVVQVIAIKAKDHG